MIKRHPVLNKKVSKNATRIHRHYTMLIVEVRRCKRVCQGRDEKWKRTRSRNLICLLRNWKRAVIYEMCF